MSPTVTQQKWTLVSVALHDAYTDFVLSRQAMQCSHSTLEFYKYTAGRFVAWLDARGAMSLHARHVREYLAELVGKWDAYRANTSELGVGDTTPVGIFLEGASPYDVLDLSGNVWEWTRSNKITGKDDLQSKDERVLRGGAFFSSSRFSRCACRLWDLPDIRNYFFGFRVVVSPNASL